jgi:hypothetical protein
MISPASNSSSPLPQKFEKLTILPLTDLHLPKPESQLITANRDYLEQADFVVLLGDMVRCYATDGEYAYVDEFVGNLKRPYTAVSGNHEWYFKEFPETHPDYGETWDRASEEEQRESIQKFKLFYGLEELWRSYTSPLGHFVFLSLDVVGVEKQECLSERQLEFLASEIERAENKPLFIFCHAPLMLGCRLGMVYYEEERTACVELTGEIRRALEERQAPSFWMSGHIHLHPDHPLFPPYQCGGNVWQIHCPDSRGYGRWDLSQWVPQPYKGPFSRHLEIDSSGVTFVTHDHVLQIDRDEYRVNFWAADEHG